MAIPSPLITTVDMVNRPSVRLCEFQRVRIVEGDEVPLDGLQYVTRTEADLVQASAARFGCSRPREWFSIVRTGGVSYLKAGCWVGVLGVGRLRLEVLPKIGTEEEGVAERPVEIPQSEQIDILEMLRVAERLPLKLKSVHGGQSLDEMMQSVLRWFMQEINSAMNLGLIRGYREIRDDLSSVKGRLDPTRQWINKCMRKPLVACVYDDFSQDTRLNRILKAGLRSAMGLAVDSGLRYSIRTTLSALEDVTSVEVSAKQAREYTPTRREQRFLALLGVAGFILESKSPDPVNPLRHDSAESPPTVGMMINMEKLFEDYAYKILKSGSGTFGGRLRVNGYDVSAQEHDREAKCVIRNKNPEEALFGLKPDLLFREPNTNRVVLVADTKWKRISPPAETAQSSPDEVVKVGTFGVRQADVYQLFAYSEYFAEQKTPSDVVLIYPQDPRSEPSVGRSGKVSKNDIKLSALPSVGTIDWEFCPSSRREGKSAKLIIKLFPLPVRGVETVTVDMPTYRDTSSQLR